jgi:hypothetical protein
VTSVLNEDKSLYVIKKATVKVAVFGILKSGGKVFIKTETLLPLIARKMEGDNLV